MSLPCRNSVALAAAIILLGGCDREKSNPRGSPLVETVPDRQPRYGVSGRG